VKVGLPVKILRSANITIQKFPALGTAVNLFKSIKSFLTRLYTFSFDSLSPGTELPNLSPIIKAALFNAPQV
jgi:hypothetical protein